MDAFKVSVFEKRDLVSFIRFMQCDNRVLLKAHAIRKVCTRCFHLSNRLDNALERKLLDEQLGRLLKLANLS